MIFRSRFFCFLALLVTGSAGAQCPTCDPDDTCSSPDGFPALCPEQMPEATANAYYEEVLTFFLPATFEDPDTGIEVALNSVTVTAVNGLPLGIDFTMNNPDNTYLPADGENLGCATLCGTPILPGEYTITIVANVVTTVFGLEFEAVQTFSRSFTVLPGAGGTTSFTASDVAGCGQLEVQFEALVNDPDNPTSWSWDFDNGNTSTEALPPLQLYEAPGTYDVALETVISAWELTEVDLTSIASGWSGDIEELTTAWSPDPYFVIVDADGNAVYTSDAVVDVSEAEWTGLNVTLSNPPYSIEIWDQDNGGVFGSDDDYLGAAPFVLEDGLQAFESNDPTGSDGTLNLALNPVVEFQDTLEIQVFPFPDNTVVVSDEVAYLNGSDLTVLWTLNGDTLETDTPTALPLVGWGVYQAEISNTFGCTVWSEPVINCPDFELSWDNDSLYAWPGMETYTWFFNGLEIEGETGPVLEATVPGNYAVTVTTDYGCTHTPEVYTLTVGVASIAAPLKVYPNPATDRFFVELPAGAESLCIRTATGALVYHETSTHSTVEVSTHELSPGMYLVEVQSGALLYRSRVILH